MLALEVENLDEEENRELMTIAQIKTLPATYVEVMLYILYNFKFPNGLTKNFEFFRK